MQVHGVKLLLQQQEGIVLRTRADGALSDLGAGAAGRQRGTRFGHQNIKAVMRVFGKPGVQQHGPRLLRQRGEQRQHGSASIGQGFKVWGDGTHGLQSTWLAETAALGGYSATFLSPAQLAVSDGFRAVARRPAAVCKSTEKK